MDIVFNVNPLGLEGLAATLTSLIRNCSNPNELKLWFLCAEFQKKDFINLDRLLKSEQFKGVVEYVDFNAKEKFGHLRSLHGDWTAYGRLLIADYVKSDVALYLDADVIILLDVLVLKNFDFDGKILGAVRGGTVAWTLDKQFFIEKLKWNSDTNYFNSGILLFNLLSWRKMNIENKWKDLTARFPNDLISHDQTLLNAVCFGDFALLTPNYNNSWPCGNKLPKTSQENSIPHFIGSPKPWDLFGKYVHSGYRLWKSYNPDFWSHEYSKTSYDKIKRTWKIRRSILKVLKNNLFNN